MRCMHVETQSILCKITGWEKCGGSSTFTGYDISSSAADSVFCTLTGVPEHSSSWAKKQETGTFIISNESQWPFTWYQPQALRGQSLTTDLELLRSDLNVLRITNKTTYSDRTCTIGVYVTNNTHLTCDALRDKMTKKCNSPNDPSVCHMQSYLHWKSVCINRCRGTTGLWQDWKVQLNIHDIIEAQFIAAGTQETGWEQLTIHIYCSY